MNGFSKLKSHRVSSGFGNFVCYSLQTAAFCCLMWLFLKDGDGPHPLGALAFSVFFIWFFTTMAYLAIDRTKALFAWLGSILDRSRGKGAQAIEERDRLTSIRPDLRQITQHRNRRWIGE